MYEINEVCDNNGVVNGAPIKFDLGSRFFFKIFFWSFERFWITWCWNLVIIVVEIHITWKKNENNLKRFWMIVCFWKRNYLLILIIEFLLLFIVSNRIIVLPSIGTIKIQLSFWYILFIIVFQWVLVSISDGFSINGNIFIHLVPIFSTFCFNKTSSSFVHSKKFKCSAR